MTKSGHGIRRCFYIRIGMGLMTCEMIWYDTREQQRTPGIFSGKAKEEVEIFRLGLQKLVMYYHELPVLRKN